ncbi:meiotic nuclear division protein 1 homolog isoform X2 [Tanacetum coccineum]
MGYLINRDTTLKTVARDAKIVNDLLCFKVTSQATTYSVYENQAFLQILPFVPHFDAVSCELKELEKLGPRKGVISQSVKDVVQSLVDDDLVSKDKIGTLVRNQHLSKETSVLNTK